MSGIDIRWHSDDGEVHAGWTADTDMRTTEPTFLVTQPEPGRWAGWRVDEYGGRHSLTFDYPTATQAKRAVEQELSLTERTDR